MIISKTPLRISFAGGGSDIPSYYRLHGGSVVSTSINKYIYVTVNKRFDDSIRVSYSKTEIVNDINKLKHGIVREAMKLVGVTKGVEITTISDIPSGTGVGSSSALTVGLLNSLYALKGVYKPAGELASEACRIEIDILKSPIGKQDQYVAAYGGMISIQFNKDESVFVEPIILNSETKKLLERKLVMFYTGITRSANKILKEQKKNIGNKVNVLTGLKLLAHRARDALRESRIDELGQILHEGWLLKKKLALSISNSTIDSYYRNAKKAGALGGKVAGAGGGGFIFLYCPEKNRQRVIKSLDGLRLVPFKLEPQGSRIIYVGD